MNDEPEFTVCPHCHVELDPLTGPDRLCSNCGWCWWCCQCERCESCGERRFNSEQICPLCQRCIGCCSCDLPGRLNELIDHLLERFIQERERLWVQAKEKGDYTTFQDYIEGDGPLKAFAWENVRERILKRAKKGGQDS